MHVVNKMHMLKLKGLQVEPIIELKNVTKTYKLGDETLKALDSVSFKVSPGDFIAITGPSGSGKSTLANIIGGLDHPDGGSVIVDGNELMHTRDNKLSSYRNEHIGFVFQSFNLQGNNTALENVMLPLVFARMKNKDRKARAKECLEAVGLGDRLKHKPTQLSGGQRQRVAIARALSGKPKIIIADEPTGNLDSAKGEEIMTLLKGLNKDGITLLIITHDMNVARQAKRVVEIRDGKITERR
ncbi:MAG: ABC-type antimicrobial peptide transport system, ATPase component [Candidatus Saccharibacteria bacterium]|nr:ABC-type antimicrobial peptide transport system, ATPase component [Candidatus Saccharibacteria bacterium]